MRTVPIFFSFGMGLLIGLFYFYTLWLTVRDLAGRQRKVWWLVVSFIFRMSVALIGFYLVMDGRWERLLACLAGFIVMRVFFSRQIGKQKAFSVTSEE